MKLGFYWSMPSVGRQTYTGGFFINLKKETRPFPELTQIKEYQYGPGLLNYEKTKPYAKGVKGCTTTFAKPDKKRSALRIQAE